MTGETPESTGKRPHLAAIEHITEAHSILKRLRDRLDELPRNRRIITYCQKGQRGYLAACALHGHGFENVANLRGGFLQARLNGLPIGPGK